jgi:hypothetical protein
MWRRRTLVHSWWGFLLIQPLWKMCGGSLKTKKIDLPNDPAIPLLIIFQVLKSWCWRDSWKLMLIVALLIYNLWQQSKLPSADEQLMKISYFACTHTHTHTCTHTFSLKEKRNSALYGKVGKPQGHFAIVT